ncbi:hypothetical protein [Streptomyces coffeae]|uniref:Uncharacterized protein n=1 Tax=Streptomyces coffeae TaxID=621382 RepID=A0ABS1NDP4_9ACTN|nr:hypothetical protein [Streptomyces coffeae]MBL1097931.1 hypothetical protein [Streptomyces coffeae]
MGFAVEHFGCLASTATTGQSIGKNGHHLQPPRRVLMAEKAERLGEMTHRNRRMQARLDLAQLRQHNGTLARRQRLVQNPAEVVGGNAGLCSFRGSTGSGPEHTHHPWLTGRLGGQQVPRDLLGRRILIVQRTRGPVPRT